MLARVLLITLLEQTVSNAIRPMVSYRALELGADPFALGLIASAFGLLAMIASLVGGSWVDRWAERRISLAGAVIMAGGCGLTLAAGTVAMLALSQAAVGFGQSIVIIASQAMLARRGKGADGGYGMYAAVASIGQFAGPLAATMVATRVAQVFAAGIVASLLVGIVVATMPRLPPPAAPAGRGNGYLPRPAVLASVLRLPLISYAMVCSALLNSSMDLLVTYLPAYGQAQGWSVEFVGALLSARALGSFAARVSTAPLLNWMGRNRLLALSLGIPAVLLAAFTLTPSLKVLAVGLVAGIGFWLGLGVPVAMHWLTQIAPDGLRGTAIGLRLAGNRFAQFFLPAAAGALGGVAGVGAIFLALAGFLTTSSAALVVAGKRRG